MTPGGTLGGMTGIHRVATPRMEVRIDRRRPQVSRTVLVPTAPLIWREACGSGARTGTTQHTMRRARPRIRRDLRLGTGGCRAVGVGSTPRNGFAAPSDKALNRP